MDFKTEIEFAAATEGAGTSATTLGRVTVSAACLNSTDFMCPRVAMIGLFLSRTAAIIGFGIRRLSSNPLPVQLVLQSGRPARRSNSLNLRQLKSVQGHDLQEKSMNKFQFRNAVPYWNAQWRLKWRILASLRIANLKL